MALIFPSRYFELTNQILQEVNGGLSEANFEADFLRKLRGPQTVTRLPNGPVNGTEVFYLADATNGAVWHLKYRATSTSTSKWEFIGGAPLYAAVETSQATASAAYTDLATVGPSLTVPSAGDYDVSFGATHTNQNNAAYIGYTSVAINGTANDPRAIITADAAAGAGITDGATVHRIFRTTFAASDALKLQYKVVGGIAVNFEKRWLMLTPVRVG